MIAVPRPARDDTGNIDAAVKLSAVLRTAKIEPALRPKVIAAFAAALSEGPLGAQTGLERLHRRIEAALKRRVGDAALRRRLFAALELEGADFNRLPHYLDAVVATLEPLDLRHTLLSGSDVLGTFYEAFLRYGYDNNALGIVFTPRHITRFCVALTGIGERDRVIDPAAGTGGFLIAALDRAGPKIDVHGSETNATTWALATLNVIFRGGAADAMAHSSCFDEEQRARVRGRFTRAYLNPPFAQVDEAEELFIDAAMDALAPGGLMAAVVYAGVFADDDHAQWRRNFLAHHTLLGIMSLPEDLFYPTAAPTSIVIARAHEPHAARPFFTARIDNDGFEKSKGRRIERRGSQLDEVLAAFQSFMAGQKVNGSRYAAADGAVIAAGSEWSPQHWLAHQSLSVPEIERACDEVVQAVFASAVHFPQLAYSAIDDLTAPWRDLPPLPYGAHASLSMFFSIENGRSAGERHYHEGSVAYVSSGDATNSVVSLVEAPPEEQFPLGGISVTAFGTAALQPWPFVARGNGGSSVRVLVPRFRMSVRELVWFAAQINLQRWRFFYARMAIKSRLTDGQFRVHAPVEPLHDGGPGFARRLRSFRASLERAAALR